MFSGKTIARVVIIVLAGFALGAANKLVNPNAPLWVGYYPVSSTTDTAVVPEAAEEGDPPYISFGEAVDLYNTGDFTFVDARDEWDYQAGHIMGAINVPFEGVEGEVDKFLAETPKDKKMVIYCGGAECDLSLYLGRTLAVEGFTDVHVFFGGWTDWQSQGMPTDTGGVPYGSDAKSSDTQTDGSEG